MRTSPRIKATVDSPKLAWSVLKMYPASSTSISGIIPPVPEKQSSAPGLALRRPNYSAGRITRLSPQSSFKGFVVIYADTILTNALALTLDPARPRAQAVAVSGETILDVGTTGSVSRWGNRRTEIIDCRGLTMLPGFHDAHCHLFALASSLTGVDCGFPKVESIAGLQHTIKIAADGIPEGRWLRGFGYDERDLAERRHPTRWDLDAATSLNPVRVYHRSGHAVVLNSRALELAGICRDTEDSPDGVIERDAESGEPTGVLLEMSGFLRKRLGPAGGTAEDAAAREEGIARLGRKLLECGITSAQDAGPGNDWARWLALAELVGTGRLPSRVTMMVGAAHVPEFAEGGMRFGAGGNRLRLGHAKLMLTLTTGGLLPGQTDLADAVARAHQHGFPVAIHAVEAEAVTAACQALQQDVRLEPHRANAVMLGTGRDRIEHVSEGTPEVIDQVKESGAVAVTQPGFIFWNGDRYRRNVAADLLPHIYPFGGLAGAAARLAFSSDAPVIDPNPWPGIAAAVTRTTRQGHQIPQPQGTGPDQRLTVIQALKAYTRGGAIAEGTQEVKGMIRPGMLADLVLVSRNPMDATPEELAGIETALTMIGGKVVLEAGL